MVDREWFERLSLVVYGYLDEVWSCASTNGRLLLGLSISADRPLRWSLLSAGGLGHRLRVRAD